MIAIHWHEYEGLPCESQPPPQILDFFEGCVEAQESRCITGILVEVLDWARLPEDFRREIERQHVLIRPAAATGAVAGK